MIKEYNIQHHKSSPYRMQTNGAVEPTNKNIKSIPRKTMETNKDFPEKLLHALCGIEKQLKYLLHALYAMPFSLVYETKTNLLIKLEVQSLRVMLEARP